MKTKEQIQKLNKSLSVLKQEYKQLARRRKIIEGSLRKCAREEIKVMDKMDKIYEKLEKL